MTAPCVLGVDPGRSKAGYALLDDSGAVVAAGIEDVAGLDARLRDLIAERPVRAIALGRGTNVRAIRAALEGLGPPIHLVDERETTRLARTLYFSDHHPRGWRRLIPLGLQVPARPIDDYAAILIGRRFLARGRKPESPS